MEYQNALGISLQDFSNICRICLNKENLNSFIELHLFTIFRNITNIEIELDNSLPKHVCKRCLNNLEEIEAFINLSRDTDAYLKKIVKEHEINLCHKGTSSESDLIDDPPELCDNPENEENDITDIVKRDTPSIIEFTNDRETRVPRHSTKRQPSSCDICGEAFSSKGRLIEHQKKNVNCKTKPFKCTKCEKAFFTKFKLNLHMASHTREKPFECSVCSKKFKFSRNVKRHDDIVHKGLKPFKCDICGKEFGRLERKIEHMNIHAGKCPYICKYCGRNFRHRSTFQNHVTEHKIKNGEIQDISENECHICKKIFLSKYMLQSHTQIHIGEKNFLCSICGKDFLKKTNLDVHSRIHTGEMPFQCKQCDKKFKYASGYRTHILFHTGERSYKCHICSKAFKQSAHLQSHLKIHTGEKPFKCVHCEKCFTHNSNLKAHTRIHTGETPYHCRTCDKGFYDSSSMKKHEKGHYRAENHI